ncbi:aminotransferase class III-fold pyridoxal phosphate-dependent enzyme [Moritella viscosa]|uniref:Glutamate-1-semialdehyde 2,1-aminomutase-Glutamate-1-semialdehyde aminotransferase n=1 Tax=Moritella viscosa TaxID=80854 RepID=A0A1L0BBZ0_9GAMM|nr:aminotransferase class III-fold pyridoxal phosphate-dependent enzyme [Moritella viscosa]SGZ00750.1 Glutamate-1-semialdehyde 2,1-aminomutase-Glutamate-1-semialdehyde aminotransferase [Moritella viscosa]SHO14274.1 Glutamate-1-semialdehyde 2,1-aminomutase-Glutamate-1-semialdehyde aminotransferase [Moritella viscosa]SHO14329.1 Glutamate-1-semialdehyde 2,1-aminomutase-Glutamate-1-semialdehyde aminotransferase [Moritella viscosa]SHO18268.1 Glutamate-1-semialdehyde 2,1-aminomutase-Glutamate-1-semia
MLSPLIGSDRYFTKTNEPILFKKAHGSTVFDQHNNDYTDFVLGLGPVILGHSDPEFIERLTQQLSNGLSFPGFADVHSELSDVYESEYNAHKVVSLFKTSSEAVTAAMRCCMLETNRKKIIRCGFLGWHDSQIAQTPSWHEWPNSNKRREIRFEEGMRGVEDSQAVFNWIDGELASLEKILIQHGTTTAAFAIDIYQLAFMSMDVFSKAVSLCQNYGIKIIFDETKTAGRTRAGGFINTDTIPADYIVLGKAIGNGLPLSVLLGKPENLHIYKNARIGGTHTKETLSANAGIIVADIMKKREGYSRLPLIGRKIVSSINKSISQSNTTELLSAVSLLDDTLFDIRFSDTMVNNFSARENLKRELIAQGVFMLQGHNSFVCLAHESLDFDLLEDKFCNALQSWNRSL